METSLSGCPFSCTSLRTMWLGDEVNGLFLHAVAIYIVPDEVLKTSLVKTQCTIYAENLKWVVIQKYCTVFKRSNIIDIKIMPLL